MVKVYLPPNGKKVSFKGSLLEGEEEPAAAAAPDVFDHWSKEKQNRNQDLSTSVQHMLQTCHDFASENPRLVTIEEEQLGAFVWLTPKCHPEIAGREIEYAWGYSKLRYRRDINDAVAAHLDTNVKKALTRELLTDSQIRKYARKASDYKLTYAYILAITQAQNSLAGKFCIEQITKLVKNHRLALDSDFSFIANS
jgi:hypothetical protein